jgi:excinuclease ABC subunit C
VLTKPTDIPATPGCYLYRNDAGDVVYVGKAKSLKARLSNYFQRPEVLDQKTRALMEEATHLEWIVVKTEADALLLENDLIKSYQPRYNLRLKDDKSYPYVALDQRSPFPVAYLTRARHVKGVKYFGPYIEVRPVRTMIDELLQTFPLRSCSTSKFELHQRLQRPCLLYDIKKCSGPCIGAIDEEEYKSLVDHWARFFDGDVKPLRGILTEQMTTSAGLRHYEAAAKYRDALGALERAASAQHVVLAETENLDVVAVATHQSRAVTVRFRVRHGRIIGRSVHYVDRSMDEDEAQILEAVVSELFRDSADIPALVVVSAEAARSDWVADTLSQRRGRRVTVFAPARGQRRRVLETAEHDARSLIERDTVRREADHNVRSRALRELADALQLPAPPYRMECFDMSHLQGTNYVGSMVVFEDGLPAKDQYRHFNIKEILGNDDAGAMAEVVRRRLVRWRDDQSGRFRPSNLVIIDGGLPQLGAVLRIAEELGMTSIEFVALAKREELLYRPGREDPVYLERGSEALYLVQRIRDEAHRFAITFHRSKRGRSMVHSLLDGVEGLGPKRRDRLLEVFGSVSVIRSASLEELRALSWLPEEVAQNIYDALRAPGRPVLKRGRDDD